MTTGTLFVIATPIGNLQDLTPRARDTLRQVDVIAAEDTRHTGKLLTHFGIRKQQIALHDHNESDAVSGLLDLLDSGKSIALVSDAGTPLISDPGYRLVRAAHDRGLTVSPLPGASAAIAAVSVAGLPSDRFAFEGFLPAKRDARVARLRTLSTETRTLVFFESVHRVRDTLSDMADVFGGDRDAFVGREITKLHEQCVKASLRELHEMLRQKRIVERGEFVIVISGADAAKVGSEIHASVDAGELLSELSQILPGSQAVDMVARLSGRKRNDVYKEMLRLKSDRPSSRE